MPLSPPNKALAARDPALPGLRLLLDDAALAEALGQSKIIHRYLRYKPGTSCLRGIEISGEEGPEWYLVFAYTEPRFAEAAERPKWRHGRHSVQLFPDQCVAIVPARRDRKLRALRRFIDPGRNTRILSVFGPDATLVPLRYKPERRLVGRVETRDAAFLLKAHAPSGFNRALPGAVAASALGGPALVHANPSLGLIACDWLEGDTLDATAGSDAFAAAGAALAAMHGRRAVLPPLAPRNRSMGDDTLEAICESLTLDPKRLSKIDFFTSRMIAEQRGSIGQCHGDFSADQCLLTANGIRIVDWDCAGIGDQGADLGSFLARLDAETLAGRMPVITARRLGTSFLEGYAKERALPRTVEAQRLRHLFMLSTEPFREQWNNWDRAILGLVDHLETALSCQTAETPGLSAALTPQSAERFLRDATGYSLSGAPKLLRHKPGRRALVRYDCQEGPAILGKLHARKRDWRTPAVHARMRELGFDGTGAGEAAVPKAWPAPGDQNLWFMEEVEGTALSEFQTTSADPAVFRRTGQALAELHAAPLDLDRNWNHGNELSVLGKALDTARETQDPVHLDRAHILAAQKLAALPPVQERPIHRDFYPDQVLVAQRKIWLLDLDLAAMGDPAIDLGNFEAHLIEYALRSTGDPWALQHHATAFFAGYADMRPAPDPHRVRVLRDVSLLRHAHIATRFPDRRAFAPGILELSLDLLSEVGTCEAS
ncbi:aminoglycoside phosphotransferase family protein [Celeribacter persicus]|uniref:Phosphotransferase family enzyme n=1 Tax=Celeribacter persicus TaxID=1651082 RepID=A0A2T5HSS1_9RHOB|nr:aminoglycoside phosphotransferase family protein [Celeribacter persicus]PTQ74591.1 phosphotransferase family enzyme [Celeribacter persicus]